MVLDHLVIQRLGNKSLKTQVRLTVELRLIPQQQRQEGFDKKELAAILKFGAAEIFKGEDQQTEEVNLDQILERAEVRTEEDAGEEGDLLGSFKVPSSTRGD